MVTDAEARHHHYDVHFQAIAGRDVGWELRRHAVDNAPSETERRIPIPTSTLPLSERPRATRYKQSFVCCHRKYTERCQWAWRQLRPGRHPSMSDSWVGCSPSALHFVSWVSPGRRFNRASSASEFSSGRVAGIRQRPVPVACRSHRWAVARGLCRDCRTWSAVFFGVYLSTEYRFQEASGQSEACRPGLSAAGAEPVSATRVVEACDKHSLAGQGCESGHRTASGVLDRHGGRFCEHWGQAAKYAITASKYLML